MAYESKKKEFSIKEEFEQYEKKQDKRKNKKDKDYTTLIFLLQNLGLAMLGGVCGLVIFFAISKWVPFSVCFLIHGLAACLFPYEFLKEENKSKWQLVMIFLADIVSVFLTLAVYFMWAEENVAIFNLFEGSVFEYLTFCFFEGSNNAVWLICLIMSFVGVFVGWIIHKGVFEKIRKKFSGKSK